MHFSGSYLSKKHTSLFHTKKKKKNASDLGLTLDSCFSPKNCQKRRDNSPSLCFFSTFTHFLVYFPCGWSHLHVFLTYLVRSFTPSIACAFDTRLRSTGICFRAEVPSALCSAAQTSCVPGAQSCSHLPCVPALLRLLCFQVCPRRPSLLFR